MGTTGGTVTDDAPQLDDAHIVATLLPLLADGAPQTFDRLFDAVVDLLPDDTDEAEDLLDGVLDAQGRFMSVDDERWIDLYAVLEGRCVTHRMSAVELAAGIIPLRPDIDIVTVPFLDPIPFADGVEGKVVFEEDLDAIDPELVAPLQGGALRGPDGWLAEADEGAIVGVWFADGVLSCRPAEPDTTLTAGAVAAIADVFVGLIANDDDPVDLIELVLTWLLRDADALRTAHEPLSALLEAAGLEQRGDFVGRTGSGWLTPHQRMRIEERALHTQVYGFDECCHDALDLVAGTFAGAIRDVALRDVATALSHGSVAEAFVAAQINRAGHHVDEVAKQLVGFADELIVTSNGTEAAGPLFVQSVAFDCLGEIVEAEDAARAALRAEPGHRAASESMATYLEVRGDGPRALEHLRRAGVRDDDPQMQRLVQVTANAGPKPARNDPCPCGSGKKFKACCIDTPTVPAELRFRWLYAKAIDFALHAARNDGPTHLAAHALAIEDVDQSPSARAAEDWRFAELSLFDEGLLERFLDEREPLLPAEEVGIAERWLERPLGVFTVTAVESGAGITLRDVVSDETVSIEGDVDVDIAVGEWLVARPLPVGDRYRLGGPLMAVPERLRPSVQELLAGGATPDACTWAEWIGFAAASESDEGVDPPSWTGSHHHSHGDGAGHHHH